MARNRGVDVFLSAVTLRVLQGEARCVAMNTLTNQEPMRIVSEVRLSSPIGCVRFSKGAYFSSHLD